VTVGTTLCPVHPTHTHFPDEKKKLRRYGMNEEHMNIIISR